MRSSEPRGELRSEIPSSDTKETGKAPFRIRRQIVNELGGHEVISRGRKSSGRENICDQASKTLAYRNCWREKCPFSLIQTFFPSSEDLCKDAERGQKLQSHGCRGIQFRGSVLGSVEPEGVISVDLVAEDYFRVC